MIWQGVDVCPTVESVSPSFLCSSSEICEVHAPSSKSKVNTVKQRRQSSSTVIQANSCIDRKVTHLNITNQYVKCPVLFQPRPKDINHLLLSPKCHSKDKRKHVIFFFQEKGRISTMNQVLSQSLYICNYLNPRNRNAIRKIKKNIQDQANYKMRL